MQIYIRNIYIYKHNERIKIKRHVYYIFRVSNIFLFSLSRSNDDSFDVHRAAAYPRRFRWRFFFAYRVREIVPKLSRGQRNANRMDAER